MIKTKQINIKIENEILSLFIPDPVQAFGAHSRERKSKGSSRNVFSLSKKVLVKTLGVGYLLQGKLVGTDRLEWE